jgi:DNA modification methylase
MSTRQHPVGGVVMPYWDNGPVQLYQADARSIPMSDQSAHCVVTSPPYFGLRVYKDNDDRGIGLESTVEDYIGNLVDVFREVRRVLRDDGVAWLNLGDSYGQNTGAGFNGNKRLDAANRDTAFTNPSGPGNRIGIPDRVVLALQADGWVWRDTIIWAKKSAMPESLAGWRWERCRVKVGALADRTHETNHRDYSSHLSDTPSNEWADCPGCPKCADNDGLVLRKGSWRTTQAHEYIYMLTKGMCYYADGEAVKTAAIHAGRLVKATGNGAKNSGHINKTADGFTHHDTLVGSAANRRSVWNDISPEPYGGAHFATFPSDLPRICIQASTSERGCCSECGSQWARVVNDSPSIPRPGSGWTAGDGTLLNDGDRPGSYEKPPIETLCWRPTCNHDAPAIPATVLDPFSGTATTCRAAQKLGRRAVGVDISESYLEQAVRRLSTVMLPMGI